MKKFSILALALVLTASMMTACRRTVEEMTDGSATHATQATRPTTEATKPTNHATTPSTQATHPSTEATKPSTHATTPSITEGSRPTDSTTQTGRGRPSNR